MHTYLNIKHFVVFLCHFILMPLLQHTTLYKNLNFWIYHCMIHASDKYSIYIKILIYIRYIYQKYPIFSKISRYFPSLHPLVLMTSVILVDHGPWAIINNRHVLWNNSNLVVVVCVAMKVFSLFWVLAVPCLRNAEKVFLCWQACVFWWINSKAWWRSWSSKEKTRW